MKENIKHITRSVHANMQYNIIDDKKDNQAL